MIGHILRPVRSLVALMAATSPYKTAASALLMLVLTFTEGMTLVLLAPLLGLVGVVEQNPLPRARNWLDSAFGAIGLEVTLGTALLLLVGVTVLRTVARRWEAEVHRMQPLTRPAVALPAPQRGRPKCGAVAVAVHKNDRRQAVGRGQRAGAGRQQGGGQQGGGQQRRQGAAAQRQNQGAQEVHGLHQVLVFGAVWGPLWRQAQARPRSRADGR